MPETTLDRARAAALKSLQDGEPKRVAWIIGSLVDLFDYIEEATPDELDRAYALMEAMRFVQPVNGDWRNEVVDRARILVGMTANRKRTGSTLIRAKPMAETTP